MNIFDGDDLPFDRGIKDGLIVYAKRLRFYLCWGITGFLLCVLVGSSVVHAGHPAKWCEDGEHKGPACDMKACARFDHDGKVNGSRCSRYCAKKCCMCGDKCQEQGPSPDEEQ
jgi:hypothetical protein